MKKWLSVVLCALMIAALLPAVQPHTASADTVSGTFAENLTWLLNTSTGDMTVSGTGAIPDYNDGEQPWSEYRDQIKSLSIENGVTRIGEKAFTECSKLKTVTISESVRAVGEAAFMNCSALTTLIIPCSTETFASFVDCIELNNITVTTGTGEWADSSWYPWNDASNTGDSIVITLENGISYIPNYTFWDSSRIVSVSIPNSVRSIGERAFAGCDKLVSCDIPNGVETIDNSAFSGCEALKTITLPTSLTRIGTNAFSGCRSIKTITIPGTLEYVGQDAFCSCSSLTSATIKSGVKNIKYGLFEGCKALTSVTIENGITAIANGMFDECEGLKKLTIPKSVTSIGSFAFYDCIGLTDITIPENVTLIDEFAFGYCSALSSVTLSNKVNKLGNMAFSGCSQLKDVWYNGSVSDRVAMIDPNAGNGNGNFLDATWHYSIEESISGTVEWDTDDVQFKGTTPYVIANGSAQTPRFTVKNIVDGSVVDPANYDYEYQENTNAGTGYVFVTFKKGYTGTCRGQFKIYLQPTTTTTVANVSNGIKLTWSKVAGADGYVIYRRAWSSTTNGWTDFVRWNNTTALNWTDTKVYAGTRYQYGIKAYFNKRIDPVTGAEIGGNVGDNFNLGEVGPLKTTVRITTRVLNSVTAGSKEMTVKWTPSKNFTGYQIKYATDKNFTKNVVAIKITDPKTAQTVIKNLKKGTTYYVTIRSYHEFNGMTYFGEWSNVKSCKVK